MTRVKKNQKRGPSVKSNDKRRIPNYNMSLNEWAGRLEEKSLKDVIKRRKGQGYRTKIYGWGHKGCMTIT